PLRSLRAPYTTRFRSAGLLNGGGRAGENAGQLFAQNDEDRSVGGETDHVPDDVAPDSHGCGRAQRVFGQTQCDACADGSENTGRDRKSTRLNSSHVKL